MTSGNRLEHAETLMEKANDVNGTAPLPTSRDHGGNLDDAIARYGGAPRDWIDLSTGINPVPYTIPPIPDDAWARLPDKAAMQALLSAARSVWSVPPHAEIIAASGTSALIARMPQLDPTTGRVRIAERTYNEHAASFLSAGWRIVRDGPAEATVLVHPNNPDGAYRDEDESAALTIIDESFCDLTPERSLVDRCAFPGTVVLKSFGKFWGLAGLRLGFAIGHPDTIEPMRAEIGPWAVSGPALHIGTKALADAKWAEATRARLKQDAARLDRLVVAAGARIVGGTDLFRLYDVGDAAKWQDRLARHHIWSRIFPYHTGWLRLGLPAPEQWARLEAAI